MTLKGKRFESIEDTQAATTAQLETLSKENVQNCFASCKSVGISAFEVEENTLRGTSSYKSFTVMPVFF